MSLSIDRDRARDLLTTEWERIQQSDESEYVADHTIRQKIREVFNASQLTYKYILFTNILAKATNPAIHYRSMQAKSDLDGAYNARSLGHQVVVKWEKQHGERLGGSNEPFLNKPARDAEFALSNAARNQSAQQRLYGLLEQLEKKTNAGEVDPVDVLRQALYEYSRLEPQTLSFESIPAAPYARLRPELESYLQQSGGGERLAAITAGTMAVYYAHAGGDRVEVSAEHANAPDDQSNAAGDVEIFEGGDLIGAIEVKDKPATVSDIQHAITKARENRLEEYHFVVGAGFRSSEKQQAIREAETAPIELILTSPDDILGLLKFVGPNGRSDFLDAVKIHLNDMRATRSNKEAFASLVSTIQTHN